MATVKDRTAGSPGRLGDERLRARAIPHEQPKPKTADVPLPRRLALVLDAVGAVPLWVMAPIVRGWHLHWGATDDEVDGSLPGDDLVPRAQFTATRAITVNAPPEQVWPWIVQLGYRRAGFYTYDLIDNASQPSADRIIHGYQHVAVGDLMPMFHESHGLAIAYRVAAFEANRWLL